MKRVLVLLLITFLFSCDKNEPNLTVMGQVKGLKKGVLFLDRLQDTTVVVLDSMVINGEQNFLLQATLEEPEVLFVRLMATNSETQRLRFFADKGTTEINTTLKRFIYDAKINGSEQQKKLEEFNEMVSKFNTKNLDLIKDQFEAGSDSTKLNVITDNADNLLKRKYLFAINFAVNNKESEIAPYIALSEIYDANLKYLDTIYKVLPPHIAKSKYGLQLENYIKDLKSHIDQ